DLAADCPRATFEGWRRHVFVDLGFSGKVGRYHDPANSYLTEVVRRRMGLPITRSVVGIELARRVGLTLVGVGMPGHFLLRSVDDPDLFVDPFDSGRVIDRAGCEERFRSALGNAPARAVPFLDSYLEPVGPRAVLTRMLANLKSVFYRRGDLANLEWVLSLRLAIPGVPAMERRDRARARAASGLLVEAADELEELAMVLPDSAADLEREALSLRARLN
ncbi:MAG: transglutaminase family protein, partial [Acidimicrobiales bacterium]